MNLSIFFQSVKNDLKNHGSESLLSSLLLLTFGHNIQVVVNYRFRHYVYSSNLPFRRKFILILDYFHHLFQGCHISCKAKIGQSVSFPHATGIVIGAAIIGDNVKIFQQVTIGSHGAETKESAYPEIDDDVVIFAGAKIIGNIKIGKNARIAAGAVVTKDVPPYGVVGGIPAKLIKYISPQN